MDPVFLKGRLRETMESLDLQGTVVRQELEPGGETQFATIVAFEAPVKDGRFIMTQLLERIRSFPFVPPTFSKTYNYIEDTASRYPTISGVSIAETNVHYRRPNSSGKLFLNPDVSKGQRMVENLGRMLDRVGPALGSAVGGMLTNYAGSGVRYISSR
jgi:hypothetical protein